MGHIPCCAALEGLAASMFLLCTVGAALFLPRALGQDADGCTSGHRALCGTAVTGHGNPAGMSAVEVICTVQ